MIDVKDPRYQYPLNYLSDEEFIILSAKEEQKCDPHAAKAWMLTAKTLYPSVFNVQFEAYIMEKTAGHVKDAAKCFSSLINTQPIPSELWIEIEAVTTALKMTEWNFLTQMFEHIPPEIQHKILLASAEHSDDTMEHCKLLLLLLKKFPQAVTTHGGKLVDTLLSAEKHSSENRYARLLVVETLPLLGSPQSPRLLQRLLVKAIDFYNTYVTEEPEGDIPDPWVKLYSVLELTGRQLGWDPYLINYSNSLNKEAYFQKLFAQHTVDDCRQLLYCGMVFLLRALHDQNAVRGGHVLLEAFSDSEIPVSKRRKGDIDITGVSSHQFQTAANCWELLHCNEIITREFSKLANQFQVKPWSGQFQEELALYRGKYDEATPPLSNVNLGASLMRCSISFSQRNYHVCLENILVAITQLPTAEGVLESNLTVGGTGRHLHFLPLTKLAVVHYCCSLLLRALATASNASATDLAIGHMLVLLQLGWPQDETIFLRLMEAIKQRGVFHYPAFQQYIVHIDILEELIYLWSEQGGSIVMDILPNAQQHLGQRRIGTRGADKGVKEDINQTIRGQVSRCNESLVNLVIQFITQERINLFQCFQQ